MLSNFQGKDGLTNTRWIFSVFEPVDLRRPPPLEVSFFGTTAENNVSSSETSKSGALEFNNVHQS